jgi:hypothetical protein
MKGFDFKRFSLDEAEEEDEEEVDVVEEKE